METPYRELEEHEAQWDRSDYESCAPCHPMVGDFGGFQCVDCLALPPFPNYKNWVMKCLQELHGDDAKEEYKKLLETKFLFGRRKFDQLRKIRILYYDEKGRLKTSRGFYEKYNG